LELKALELCENSKNHKTKKWLGSLYNNIGWAYHGNGKFINALELFEKALTFKKEKKDEKGVFIAKWTIARTFRSLDRIEEALELQCELLRAIKAGKVKTDGYVYEEIGECLLLQNNTLEASKYFKLAFNLLSQNKWIQTYEPARLKRLEKMIK